MCLAPTRIICNEDDFSENSRCISEVWLTYIDLKHAILLLSVHETAVTGIQMLDQQETIMHGDCRYCVLGCVVLGTRLLYGYLSFVFGRSQVQISDIPTSI